MQSLSPNKQIGRGGQKPEAIVVHIAEGTFDGTLAWFRNVKSQVSAHFVISESGTVCQCVETKDTAWHAGKVVNPSWKLLKRGLNPNSYTIGIELAGFAKDFRTKDQIWALATLLYQLCDFYKIPLDRNHIIRHNEIRADKTCPGPNVNLDAIVWLASLFGR